MADLNQVTLCGRLSETPEVKPAGSSVNSRFSIATSYLRGEEEQTDWHRCVAWSGTAEAASTLSKGELVFAMGKLKTSSYDKNGQKIYSTEVVVHSIARVAFPNDRHKEKSKSSGPPGSFSRGSDSKKSGSVWPFVDVQNLVNWNAPDEEGFSYATKGEDSLCVGWNDSDKPSEGGTVYLLIDGEWEPNSKILPSKDYRPSRVG